MVNYIAIKQRNIDAISIGFGGRIMMMTTTKTTTFKTGPTKHKVMLIFSLFFFIPFNAYIALHEK